MVFLGNISDDTSGFKKHKNTAGLTNAILLEKLSGISVSFGTPKMGTMMKKEAVVYEHVSDTWDVYVLANDKNVQIGRVYSQGVNAGLGALKEAGIKKKLVAITPEYTLFEGNENIGHIKKKIKLGRAEIQGEVKGQPIMIKGDMVGHSFNIFLNGKAVGNVDTARLTWGDCYSIEVLDESVKDLVVTIAVICDNTLKGND